MRREEESSPFSWSPLEIFSTLSLSPRLGSPNPWLTEMQSEERSRLWLIQQLVSCAKLVAAGNIESANVGLGHISHLASPGGDSMQRVAAYFTEALAHRMLKRWRGCYDAINSAKMRSLWEEILIKRYFFELCPFLRVAYQITNQAIIEAMEREKMVHIIDLNSFEPAQWVDLLGLFKARPEGPPHLKITGIHEHKEVLEQMAYRLTQEAGNLNIPFQFNPVVSKLENLDVESLRVKTGEALVISSVLQLHSLLAFEDEMLRRNSPVAPKTLNPVHLQQRVPQINPLTLGDFLQKDVANLYIRSSPDTASSSSSPLSLAPSPRMGSFLQALRGLSPKLMVVTEQESNHNAHNLIDRVTEALNFYGALFDGLESNVSRASQERQKVEKMLFGEEIKNIISSEGLDRKERHEKLEKWIPRLELYGFGRVRFSYYCMVHAKRVLVQNPRYQGYEIKQDNDCLVVCWKNTPLFSISAWRKGTAS